MAIAYNLEWFRGEDVTLNVTLLPPTDITGWSLAFTVKDVLGGTTKISKAVGGGITVSDGGRGRFAVSVAKADTSGLAVGAYVFDVKRTDAGANAVLLYGTIFLKQEVTL